MSNTTNYRKEDVINYQTHLPIQTMISPKKRAFSRHKYYARVKEHSENHYSFMRKEVRAKL